MLSSASVSGSIANLVARYCQQRNLPCALPPAQFAAQDRLPIKQLTDALSQLEHDSQDDSIALKIGSSARVLDAGLLGELAAACESLWDLLLRMTQYHRLVYDVNELDIQIHPTYFEMAWGTNRSHPTAAQEDLLLSIFVSILRQILQQPDFKPVSIDVMHSPTTQPEQFSQFYQCAVYYNAPTTVLRLPISMLNAELHCKDSSQMLALEVQADRLLSELQPLNLLDRDVESVLLAYDLRGEDSPSLEQIAQDLHVSSNTLKHRLGQLGVSVQQMFERVRSTHSAAPKSKHPSS